MAKKKKKNVVMAGVTVEDKIDRVKKDIERENVNIFGSARRSIKELVAPDGVNPNPYEYTKIHDGGVDLYTVGMYISEMPKKATFATTFAPLFNFIGATSNVFIEPTPTYKAIKMLDQRVIILDSEELAATKDGDRNRRRKISSKLFDTEEWAEDIENGRNKLYDVAFLFILQARSYDELVIKCSEFHSVGTSLGIELSSCYSVHPEAIQSGFPANRIYSVNAGNLPIMNMPIIQTAGVQKHTMDMNSLACIFNHTKSEFFHPNGVVIGRNMVSHKPITFDAYDKSHMAYTVAVAGSTGTGKSTLVKCINSRAVDFGTKICSIDVDKAGGMGEYARMAKHLGGENFTVEVDGKNIINPYDIDVQMDYDEEKDEEFPVLNVLDKITDVNNILLTMITNGKEIPDFKTVTFIEKHVDEINASLYDDRGIVQGEVDSIYDYSSQGLFGTGRKKKELPTISDFYKKAYRRMIDNDNNSYSEPLLLIVDSMSKYVKFLAHTPKGEYFFNKEEYDLLPINKEGKKVYIDKEGKEYPIKKVQGTHSFYDGQSTIHVDLETPHVNIDLSRLPEKERYLAETIACSYLNEYFIKKNSANPKKAQKRVIIIDEAHKMFHYVYLRRFLADLYRTARKYHVSPWTLTQALADYEPYEETRVMLKQTVSLFLLKQPPQDRKYILDATCLTPSQVDRVISLGGDPNERVDERNKKYNRKGEVCLIDNNSKVVFFKVDYLETSEFDIVETDMAKIAERRNARGR